ncbi:AI-2E family transporter [Pseudokineococcus sp. 1T1Z-3]|uniref:AI-2E family transporter n=1 Tax=Pseudokineococcus sp. 1T1Z-3 TaxID=3132745 RepID=UPI0030B36AC9
MTLLERLRDARRPQRVAVVDDAETVHERAVDAVVEMRPPRMHPKSRFGRLEQAATAVALWVLRVLVIVVGIVALLWVVQQLWVIVLPVILALILSTILWPGVKVMRRVMPAALAAAIALLAFLGAIVGLFALIIPRVISQAAGLQDQVVGGFETVQQTITDATENGLLGVEGDQITQWIDQGVERIQSSAEDIAGSLGGGLLTGLTTVGSALITLLLVLVLAFLFTKDGPRFLPWLHLWSGSKVADHIDELLGRVWKTLGGYIGSQAAVALVDAVFIGLGLWALGVPFPFPLAVLVFFGGFIPIVGAVATGIIAVLVALFANGPFTALLVALLVLAVQQVESNVLQPILVGKTLALHPAVVILAVTAGGTLAGIIGAFLAVPVVAVTTVVLRYVREAVIDEEPDGGGGKPPMSPGQKKEVERLADEGEDTTKATEGATP